MQVRAWIDEGALIAASSVCDVSFFDPLLSLWGLITRSTRTVGVQGPGYRVDTYTAIRLYTAAGGQAARRGSRRRDLGARHHIADVVGFRTDLLDCQVDDLPSQQPALTLVGGRPVHDPDGLLGSAEVRLTSFAGTTSAGDQARNRSLGVPETTAAAFPEDGFDGPLDGRTSAGSPGPTVNVPASRLDTLRVDAINVATNGSVPSGRTGEDGARGSTPRIPAPAHHPPSAT